MTKYKMAVSHRERLIEELRADPEFAVLFLREGVTSLANPEEREIGMSCIRYVAQAYGGLGKIAEDAGISHDALYSALSPKDDSALDAFQSMLGSIGLRLSVEPVPA